MRGLSRVLVHHLARLKKLAMAHAWATCASCVGSLLLAAGLRVRWHLLNLSPVLQMGHVVLVEVRLGDDGFLIKQSLRKGVVLSFNSLGFALAYAQI